MRLERLLAGATVLGGAIYVLIYALYIEFYDDFGVRPEEVGWDRLAVLGRAAWVALVGIAIVVPASWIITASTDRSRLEFAEVERIKEQLDETEQSELQRYLSRVSSNANCAGCGSVVCSLLLGSFSPCCSCSAMSRSGTGWRTRQIG